MREILNKYIDYFLNFLTDKRSYELFLLVAFIFLIVFISDYLFRFIISKLFKKINTNSKFDWYVVLYKKGIFSIIAHFFSLAFGFSLIHIFLIKFKSAIHEIDKLFFVLITLVFFQLIFKFIDLIGLLANKEEETYKTVAYRTFSQFLKIVTFIIGFIVIISLLFDLNLNTIITSISAITAIILLIFKDTIVGFVSGIQISTSKILKVGDFIKIEKFNLEGTVREINLTSTKIENADKTLSFIPTYDLLSSKIINYQRNVDLNLKKIIKIIYFKNSCIKYLKKDELDKILNNFPSLKSDSKIEIKLYESKPISNLELFITYLNLYIYNHEKIRKSELILSKIQSITNHTIPIQLSFFCNSSKPSIYEEVVTEIIIHAIIISNEFELELIDKEI